MVEYEWSERSGCVRKRLLQEAVIVVSGSSRGSSGKPLQARLSVSTSAEQSA
jgi:hypothetical protein